MARSSTSARPSHNILSISLAIELNAEERAALDWWENLDEATTIQTHLRQEAFEHVNACVSMWRTRNEA